MPIISSPPGPPLPVSIANGGTNSGTSLNNSRIMVSSAGAVVEAGAMTNGQLLIGSTGAAPVVAALTAGSNITITNAAGAITVAATAGSAPKEAIWAVAFETAGRYSDTLYGSGTATYNSNGLIQNTTVTGTSGVKTIGTIGSIDANDTELGSPQISAMIAMDFIGTDVQTFTGIGNITISGTSITYTSRHIGFKIVRAASGTTDLSATQGDNVAETASASLAAVTTSDDWDLVFKVNSSTSVDYYNRKNGGAQSAATNLAANFPTPASHFVTGISNVATATRSQLYVTCASYRR